MRRQQWPRRLAYVRRSAYASSPAGNCHCPLQAAAIQAGLLGPNMIGLTLGYSIFIRKGEETARLLAHEFRHVYQVEQHGSLANVLPIYLQQVVTMGYENAPFEIDARAHEAAAS